MIVLYLLSATSVLIVAAIVACFLLYRVIDLLERITTALERMEARDRDKTS